MKRRLHASAQTQAHTHRKPHNIQNKLKGGISSMRTKLKINTKWKQNEKKRKQSKRQSRIEAETWTINV